MGLLDRFFGNKKRVIAFLPPFYQFNEVVMNYLEKKGYDLKYRSSKRNLIIVETDLRGLNSILKKFDLKAVPLMNLATLNTNASLASKAEIFCYSLDIIPLGDKKHFKKNVQEAGLFLYEKGLIYVHYAA